MQRPRRGGSGLGACLERQKAVGFGDAEVFVLKYNSRMKTVLEKGLHPARTLLKPGNPLSARICCSQSSSLPFKSFTVILVNLSEDFSKVLVFRLHHS